MFLMLISGSSKSVARLLNDVKNAAPYKVNALIVGPTGAGKELVAQCLHDWSNRSGNMVSVNCAAIPRELLEAELFGHEKGAFTGATTRRIGRFEEAAGGTLFLDEIGDMPLELQSKILRVIETKSVCRVGSNKEVHVDFRLICATHQNIQDKVKRGEFREDLMYRISVIVLDVPSLKDRIEDFPDLITALCNQIETDGSGLTPPTVNEDGLREMVSHSWPGNVRELKNFLQRAAVLYRDVPINAETVRRLLHFNADRNSEQNALLQAASEIPDADNGTKSDSKNSADAFENVGLNVLDYGFCLKRHLSDIETELIVAALSVENQSITGAAKRLALNRTTLIAKMGKYGIK
jgi:sigma-54 specific flagellar transcriptional regulator A